MKLLMRKTKSSINSNSVMNRIKGFVFPKAAEELLKCGILRYSMMKKKHELSLLDAEKVRPFHTGLSYGDLDHWEISTGSRNMLLRSILPCDEGKSLGHRKYPTNVFRLYSSSSKDESSFSRDFLVQLWVADKKMEKLEAKRKKITAKSTTHGKRVKSVLKQPPPSQHLTGLLQPTSEHEAHVANLLARSTLLITRDIEWANLMVGFEQENRYAIVDVSYPQSPAGFIREQSNLIARQVLRTRRPFVAYITDALGSEVFRVRRPIWWITSSIYAEIDGKEVGVVHRRWHLWKRIYDLYLGNEQFAVVENPGFWNWTFTLKDINGEVLAQIDRDWRGFGFEIFTDAGQYVIRFGSSDIRSKIGPASLIDELEVVRPLTLSERAVAVALAVSLDNDYFSRHGGWGIPFFVADE